MGPFTCDLQLKLPAFADNFARASFTVYVVEAPSDVRLTSFVKKTMGLTELRACGSHRIRKIHPDTNKQVHYQAPLTSFKTQLLQYTK